MLNKFHSIAVGAILTLVGGASLFPTQQVFAKDDVGASPWAKAENSRARLISSVVSMAPEGQAQIGFQVKLDPGWHFYWRTKSESGIPPKFDWSQSSNVDRVDISWPTPHRMDLAGYEAIAYSDHVVLPMVLTVLDPNETTRIHLSATFAVCKDICILHDEEFALELGSGSGEATPHAEVIEGFASKVPSIDDGGDVKIKSVRLVTVNSEPVLEIEATAKTRWRDSDIFVEGPPNSYFRRPEIKLSNYGRAIRFRLPVSGDAFDPSDTPLVLTFVGAGPAVEHRVVLTGAK